MGQALINVIMFLLFIVLPMWLARKAYLKYTKIPVVKMTLHGSSYITTVEALNDVVKEYEALSAGDRQEAKIEFVNMSKAEYNSLPEFDGF